MPVAALFFLEILPWLVVSGRIAGSKFIRFPLEVAIEEGAPASWRRLLYLLRAMA